MTIKLLTEHHLKFLSLKEAAQARVSLFMSDILFKATLLEITCRSSIITLIRLQMHMIVCFSCLLLHKQVFSLPSLEVTKLFSYSTQLSTKLILLINVKMPTIVGILTFISRMNTTLERLKARNFFICPYCSFMSS